MRGPCEGVCKGTTRPRIASLAVNESNAGGRRRAAVIRGGVGEGIELAEVLRVRHAMRDEGRAERWLNSRLVAELQMAQRAIHGMLRVIVQR